LRGKNLAIAASAFLSVIWIAVPALGQQPPPPPHSLRDLFRPPPRQAAAQETQTQSSVIFDATSLGSPVLLDKGWRVGITSDSLDAAAPEFDDSKWEIREARGFMSDIPDTDSDPDSGKPGSKAEKPDDNKVHIEVDGKPVDSHGGKDRFVWFRLHIKLAPNHGPLALYLALPVSKSTTMSMSSSGPSADVFANGKQLHPDGPHANDPQHYQQISRIYDLNLAPSETSLTVAVRGPYIGAKYGAYAGLFSNRSLHLGNRADLDNELALWSARGLFERMPRLVISILLLVLALFLLALYFSQKGHIEYLWLALHELVQAPIGFVDLAGSSAHLDQLWYAALTLQLVFISAYLYFEFLIAFLALRKRWYILLLRYTAPIMAGIAPTLLLVGHSHFVGILLAIVFLGSFVWIIGWALFVFVTLIFATLRRNFEAGLLLIPLALSIVGIIEPMLTAAGMSDSANMGRSPLTIQAGPIPFHATYIADFAGIFVIVLIIFVRFLRIQQQQQHVTSELAAARSVQELMIPQEKLETPGFEVDSIYNPAAEVGGDFFHVETTRDGGLLVVIGDVAGKGLKAAMNVSMLMGALRRTPDRSPAKILESLNRVLVGSDSFTTCQAAWFGANGELVLSNAGHLPPYLNSQEIVLPGGLPLGVLPDNAYEEVRLYLHPGDRILLMSDGVVEARQPSGELFGFDRVHNLSNQTAFYIADAAKAFGQEDDITVLTVRRLAEAMAA
jgi:phosphoserine phosphatase RsbU/P